MNGRGILRKWWRTWGTADGEGQRGCTRAVGDSNGTREVNEITRGHVVELSERLFNVDDLVETDVGVEGSLNGVEGHDRPVSAIATAGKG